MDFNVNLTRREATISRTATTTLQEWRVHQNDKFTLSVWLMAESGDATAPLSVVAMPAEFSKMVVAARSLDDLLEASLLFSAGIAVDFVAVGSGPTLHYEAELNVNTAALAAKFPGSDHTKRALSALLDIELRNADATKILTVVGQLAVKIQRDVYRGTEGVPLDGDPAYPLPADIALREPEDGAYRITPEGLLQLWNVTQGDYQTVSLIGAAGAESLAIAPVV